MRSIRRILVAIGDPEAGTTPALVKAGQLARALGAQIEAERALDLLSCDVLVVKPEHFSSRVPRARRGGRLIALALPV